MAEKMVCGRCQKGLRWRLISPTVELSRFSTGLWYIYGWESSAVSLCGLATRERRVEEMLTAVADDLPADPAEWLASLGDT